MVARPDAVADGDRHEGLQGGPVVPGLQADRAERAQPRGVAQMAERDRRVRPAHDRRRRVALPGQHRRHRALRVEQRAGLVGVRGGHRGVDGRAEAVRGGVGVAQAGEHARAARRVVPAPGAVEQGSARGAAGRSTAPAAAPQIRWPGVPGGLVLDGGQRLLRLRVAVAHRGVCASTIAAGRPVPAWRRARAGPDRRRGSPPPRRSGTARPSGPLRHRGRAPATRPPARTGRAPRAPRPAGAGWRRPAAAGAGRG